VLQPQQLLPARKFGLVGYMQYAKSSENQVHTIMIFNYLISDEIIFSESVSAWNVLPLARFSSVN
jgi:hypothetical protein